MMRTLIDVTPEVKEEKKGPKFMNLQNTLAKKAHDDNEERLKTQPMKTILEMYKTIGSVNGPGWRPMPNRPQLETSICLIMDQKVRSLYR